MVSLVQNGSSKKDWAGTQIDELLSAFLAKGNQQAGSEIVKRFGLKVEGVVRFLLNKRFCARVCPKDISQEVFAEACNGLRSNRQTFITDARFRAWIGKIARNQTIKTIERHEADKRDVRRESSCPDMGSLSSRMPGNCANHTIQEVIVQDEINHAKTRLDAECRTVLQLLLAGFTRSEIADELGVSPRTVQRRKQKIKEAFAHLNQSA